MPNKECWCGSPRRWVGSVSVQFCFNICHRKAEPEELGICGAFGVREFSVGEESPLAIVVCDDTEGLAVFTIKADFPVVSEWHNALTNEDSVAWLHDVSAELAAGVVWRRSSLSQESVDGMSKPSSFNHSKLEVG